MAVGTESDSESPPIRSLGPLFVVTEVHIWDDNKVNCSTASTYYNALKEEPNGSCPTTDAHSSIIKTIDDYYSAEDLELALQMDSLGLPVSFSTTKKKNASSSGKRKGMRVKSRSTNKQIEYKVPVITKVSEQEYMFPSVIHDSSSMPAFCNIIEGQSEASNNDVEEEHNRKNVCSEGEDISVASAVLNGIDENQVCGETINHVDTETKPSDIDSEKTAEILEHPRCLDAENFPSNVLEDANSRHYQEGELSIKQDEEKYSEFSSISCNIVNADGDAIDINTFQPCVSSAEMSLSTALSGQNDHGVQDYSDTRICYEYGDWRVIWDSFYMRNYFYNVQTQESTWYPPDGLEKSMLSGTTVNLNEMFTDAAEASANVRIACDANQDQISDGLQDTTNGNSHTCASDSLVLLHSSDVKDHTTGWDVSKYWDEQHKNATFHEGLNTQISFAIQINNSLSTTNNKIDMDESGESHASELENHNEITTTGKKRRARRLQSRKRTLSS